MRKINKAIVLAILMGTAAIVNAQTETKLFKIVPYATISAGATCGSEDYCKIPEIIKGKYGYWGGLAGAEIGIGFQTIQRSLFHVFAGFEASDLNIYSTSMLDIGSHPRFRAYMVGLGYEQGFGKHWAAGISLAFLKTHNEGSGKVDAGFYFDDEWQGDARVVYKFTDHLASYISIVYKTPSYDHYSNISQGIVYDYYQPKYALRLGYRFSF